jgi:hypothetical protein
MPTKFDTPTVPTRRDKVHPGQIIQSSHGYRLLITDVIDTAVNRTDDRHVELRGHLHGQLGTAIRNERYPAGSLIPVERPSRCFQVHLAVERPDMALSARYDYVFANDADEARARAVIAAQHEFRTDGWQVESVEEVA